MDLKLEKLTLKTNNKNTFIDPGVEPFQYVFPKEEQVEGHLFRHVLGGMYKASPCFTLTEKEMKEWMEQHLDLEFGVLPEFTATQEQMYKVVCARSKIYFRGTRDLKQDDEDGHYILDVGLWWGVSGLKEKPWRNISGNTGRRFTELSLSA